MLDTDICRSINTIPKKAKYTASKNVCVKEIGSWASMVLQNYQYFIEMTSNMIYIVAIGSDFKCPRKIHLKTHCPSPSLALELGPLALLS